MDAPCVECGYPRKTCDCPRTNYCKAPGQSHRVRNCKEGLCSETGTCGYRAPVIPTIKAEVSQALAEKLDSEILGGKKVEDFKGAVDGGGYKASMDDLNKLPLWLVPARVLEMTQHFGVVANDRGTDPILCVIHWLEGGSDALLFDALKSIAAALPNRWPDLLREVTKVLQYGQKKYAAHNWRRGMPFSQVGSAVLRHYFFGIQSGEPDDRDTGFSHWAHIACNIVFLIEYTSFPKLYGKFDDRFKRPEAE